MGKKSDTANPTTAIAGSPASKPATPASSTGAPKAPPAAVPVVANGDGAPAKVSVKKKPAARSGKASKTASKAKPVGFSTGDIALRAYFIAEHRQRHGLPGNSHSDWIQAEKQLRAEHKKTAAKKPATAKKRA